MSDQSTQMDTGARFVLVSERDGERTPVDDGTTVGRGDACDVVVASERLSRKHAKLAVDDGVLWVEDQRSTNGTYVNGQRIGERTRLRDGDLVQFADAGYRVMSMGEQAAGEGTVVMGAPTREQLALEVDEHGNAQPPGDSPAPSGSPGVSPNEATPREGVEQASAGSGGEAAPKQAASERQQAPAAAGAHAIPPSWAASDQLAEASGTAFVARGSAEEDEERPPSRDPGEAIAEARQSVAAGEGVLVGLNEPVETAVYRLPVSDGAGKWEMGRGEGADILIDHESVSGRHAQLVCENGRWRVVNMMAMNGTFVNDRKVLSAFLNPRDRIRMGTVELAFDPPAGQRGASRTATGTPGSAGNGGALGWLRKLFDWLRR